MCANELPGDKITGAVCIVTKSCVVY